MHRIMIVDDDVFIAMALEENLRSIGYDVVGTAVTGKAAIETARERRPDLILMDIILPGEPDGIGAAQQIISELDIPVVFITGYKDIQLLNRAKEVQPFGYILKPLQELQLKAVIDIALSKKDLERRLQKSRETVRQMSTHLIRVQENERKRIALELHDEVGQALSLLKLRIGTVAKRLPDDRVDLKNECKEITDYILQMLENVRRLSRDLSPRIIEDLGLSSALRWLIGNASQHMRIESTIDVEDIPTYFPHEIQVAIYRIFQEATTNLLKHSQATEISLSVRKDETEDIFHFLLKDNGIGFDLDQHMGYNFLDRGLGLAAMEERAKMLGGTLKIWTEKGKGTSLSLSVPANSLKEVDREKVSCVAG